VREITFKQMSNTISGGDRLWCGECYCTNDSQGSAMNRNLVFFGHLYWEDCKNDCRYGGYTYYVCRKQYHR
jgi:hypothetical protein